MKTLLTILSSIFLTQLCSQTIDKEYIVKWITAADSTYDVEAVVKYSIDGKSYYTTDTVKLNNRLQQIPINRLKGIAFSKYKTDNYVPGRGTIYVQTIRKQSLNDVKDWMTHANKLFVDDYASFSQHILTNAKDPILVIDNKIVHHSEAKTVLKRLSLTDIYDIYISPSPVPFSIYGQNAKNGLVQIWTTDTITD